MIYVRINGDLNSPFIHQRLDLCISEELMNYTHQKARGELPSALIQESIRHSVAGCNVLLPFPHPQPLMDLMNPY